MGRLRARNDFNSNPRRNRVSFCENLQETMENPPANLYTKATRRDEGGLGRAVCCPALADSLLFFCCKARIWRLSYLTRIIRFHCLNRETKQFKDKTNSQCDTLRLHVAFSFGPEALCPWASVQGSTGALLASFLVVLRCRPLCGAETNQPIADQMWRYLSHRP